MQMNRPIHLVRCRLNKGEVADYCVYVLPFAPSLVRGRWVPLVGEMARTGPLSPARESAAAAAARRSSADDPAAAARVS